jgi:preprotein translocase subunit SecG
MSGILLGFVTALHVVVCIALMSSILLQSGKGGGLAGAFGAGSSQTLFGGRGAASFLSRATTVLSVVFFLTSLTLGISASRTRGGAPSLIQEEARRRAQQRTPSEGAQPPSGAPAAPQGVSGAAGRAQAPPAGAPLGPTPAAPTKATPTTAPPAPPAPAGATTK